MINAIDALRTVSDGASTSKVSQTVYGQPVGGAQSVQEASQVSFSDALANVSMEAVQTLKDGEAAAISGVSGKASAQQVVEAVMSAQTTLQTAIAIRDKVVSAYQEVSRMAI
ncbi:flagellar hook-basal body complex protein FliE [Breoghania corrubedonensis]|uniref:Flagellar hook-basal body complex protein FliE n=1 Tax=Breoghania corrubedonensis TaxID=665038 RepID=A0A2T5V8R9_9HYPH|nr:flagellar hook-basal body complex protein FliE [Breoghania corrubedonensis]PTW60147.1 flagellar hook-basal body complex protein FliE [Breoghania corrubedonensis]